MVSTLSIFPQRVEELNLSWCLSNFSLKHLYNDLADSVAKFTTLCIIPAECVEGLNIHRKTALCQMPVTVYSTALGMCAVAIYTT